MSEQILEAAGTRPEGSLLTAKHSPLALGKRDAVDQDPKARLHSGRGKPPNSGSAKVSSYIHDESRSAYQEAALQGPNVKI